MGGDMGGDMGKVQCKTYHTVMHGETGSEIAYDYGVSTYALAEANGLPDVNNVWGGRNALHPSRSATGQCTDQGPGIRQAQTDADAHAHA